MLLIENAQNSLELTEELEQTVEKVCIHALETEGFEEEAQISITFVDNEEIRKINSEHRDIDSVTDVLSFPMLEFDENGEADADFDFDDGEVMLGDIVISLERAAEQAENYGHSLKREVAFLTAHSVLHLLGYDHMDSEEEKIMFEKQEKILEDLGITREVV
ncbi:MAG: rRNA maturation RNase YbeY [Clostridia bacterium]|nr:rRNA maturation RNase YbeY [Clostridia bacterium]